MILLIFNIVFQRFMAPLQVSLLPWKNKNKNKINSFQGKSHQPPPLFKNTHDSPSRHRMENPPGDDLDSFRNKNKSLTKFLEISGWSQEETQRGSAPAPRRFFKNTHKTRDFLKQPLNERISKHPGNYFLTSILNNLKRSKVPLN